MSKWFWFLPVGALIALAAYLGLRAGDIPTETEIINRYAAAYISTAPEGADPTDCAATPHLDDVVRMVITCAHESGLTTTYFVGLRGETLPEPQGSSA